LTTNENGGVKEKTVVGNSTTDQKTARQHWCVKAQGSKNKRKLTSWRRELPKMEADERWCPPFIP